MSFTEWLESFLCCWRTKSEGLNETCYYEYADSVPVYSSGSLDPLHEGQSFIITGYILMNCERFSINFIIENEYHDIALHINPRLPQNFIVRNSKAKNIWGREEVSSALPFSLRRGSDFSIQVLVTHTDYLISVNGHHFAQYKHRFPYALVTKIEVKGDVDGVDMIKNIVEQYPTRSRQSIPSNIRLDFLNVKVEEESQSSSDEVDAHIPNEFRTVELKSAHSLRTKNSPGLTLPYYGALPEQSLIVGRSLKIEGRVKLLPHSFYINLQEGTNIWPHPVIAFHFNPRFSQKSGPIGQAIVCRNAWFDGAWAEEERSELATDFRPGKTFKLSIDCCSSAFEVYVNKKFVTRFKYLVRPEKVTTVYIQGDIKLWDVVLEQSSRKSKNVITK